MKNKNVLIGSAIVVGIACVYGITYLIGRHEGEFEAAVECENDYISLNRGWINKVNNNLNLSEEQKGELRETFETNIAYSKKRLEAMKKNHPRLWNKYGYETE